MDPLELCENGHPFICHLSSLDMGSQPQQCMGKAWTGSLLLMSPLTCWVWGITPSLPAPLQTAPSDTRVWLKLCPHTLHYPCATAVNCRWSTPPTALPETSSVQHSRLRLSSKYRERNFSQNTYLRQRPHS